MERDNEIFRKLFNFDIMRKILSVQYFNMFFFSFFFFVFFSFFFFWWRRSTFLRNRIKKGDPAPFGYTIHTAGMVKRTVVGPSEARWMEAIKSSKKAQTNKLQIALATNLLNVTNG